MRVRKLSLVRCPPKSPVYNVTYVTQTTTPQGYVQSSYAPGYLGVFVADSGHRIAIADELVDLASQIRVIVGCS